MSNQVPFCTCDDTSCSFHPTNHDKGCTPCIAKNIKENEVPTCIFKKADPDYAGPGYKVKDFAQLVSGNDSDLLNLMASRRSIRKYPDEEIPEEKLTKILQAALLAPTSRGKQPWEFYVIKDKELLQKLSKAKQHGAALLADCNTAIAVFADSDLSDAWIEDSSAALGYMYLMAAEQGVGSCWVQMRMRKDADGNDAEQNVRDLLGVELPWRMVGIMALGMPAEEKAAYSTEELKWEKVHR